jgi:hypothetical protein
MAGNPGSTLNWIEKQFMGIANYLGAGISRFVAFLFLLFAVGAFFGAFVYTRFPSMGIYLILVPAVLGLIAYYSRTAAIVMFIGFIIFII